MADGELARLRSEMRAGLFNECDGRARSAHKDSDEGIKEQLRETFEADPEIFDSPYFEILFCADSRRLCGLNCARGAVRATREWAASDAQLRNAGTCGLVATLPSLVRFAPDPLAPMIGSSEAPSAIALIGPTGVGKTTTIAKLAAQVVCRLRRRVVLGGRSTRFVSRRQSSCAFTPKSSARAITSRIPCASWIPWCGGTAAARRC
ncbi:MAG: hypothetical protein U0Y68_05825 [Blastocatellia bacterium]